MNVHRARFRRGLATAHSPRGSLAGIVLTTLLVGLSLAAAAGTVGGQPPEPNQGFLRFPGTNGRDIVFSSEGDLWIAPLTGGTARRITADDGEESLARFSPDGSRIAFSGQYGGNTDVFVIPAEGGRPSRLTYHPAVDQVVGWTPDGKVLFRSRRDEPQYDWRLFVVSPDGGDPEILPLAQAALASFAQDERRIAFTRFSLEWHHWKQYQGGWAQDIYAGDLDSGEFKQITDYKGMDAFPMWLGDRIFFLSDRDGAANIYSMAADGSDVRRATHHTEADVRWPSLGGGRIVYQVAYDIWTLDPASGVAQRVDLRLPSDRVRTLPRVIAPLEQIQGYALGREGKRLVLCARGDLASAPAKDGRVIALTSSQGVRDRDPVCSPDGSSVAYISDATGEEEIFIVPASGGVARQVTSGSSCYHYPLVWAPDGKTIAYSDRTLTLFAVDVAKGTRTAVARSDVFEIRSYAFSPDSKWIAWSQTEPNQNRAIYIRAVAGGPPARVTDPMNDSWDPAWDRDGNYLFFLSRRTINPYMGNFEENFLFMNGTKPYLLVLGSGDPSPFAPKDLSADEDDDAAEASATSAEATGGGRKEAGTPSVTIDLDGLADRISEVPVDAGNCATLRAAAGRIFWLAIPNEGMGAWPEDEDEERDGGATLHSFTIEDREDHPIATGIDDYSLSPDGTKICTRSGRSFAVIAAEAEAPLSDEESEDATIDLAAWDMTIDPIAEWRQMFDEAWRLERDFFWDPNMLGVDWQAMRERYGAFLPRVTTRGELTDLLGELIAELRTSHEYVWGGDDPGRKPLGVGRLGVDLETIPSGGGLRIGRIYGTDRWNPERSSPLLLPGLRVKEGDYLLAIDGVPVSSVEETHRLLAGKSEEPVVLRVSSKPDGSDGRDIYVKTMKSDEEARYDQWVSDKREYVAMKTGGRVGYIHIPDMDTAGIVEFGKQFFPQSDKEGLIVDVRNNAGGYAHSMLLERLYRKLWSFANARYLKPLRTPAQAFYGHMVGLCDQRTGSDGESFAEAFKRMGLGPMVGMRTWGGFVGIRGNRALMDGGGVTQPEWPAWGFDRKWLIEGEGVIPDIVVDNDPSSGFRGLDPQLDRAIATVLEKMDREPRPIPEPPPYPIKAPPGR